MKKLIVLPLVLGLLTACTAGTANITVPAAESRAVRQNEEEKEAPCYYTVDMVVWTDSAQAEDGTPLAECRYQLPELTARRSDGTPVLEAGTEAEARALEIAGAFNGRFEEWVSAREFQELTDMAREDLKWRREEGVDWFGPYALGLTSSAYQTEHLVSVTATYYSSTGGAHPNTACLGWNFDLTSGTFFDLNILAEDGAAFSAEVREELLRQARAVAAENGLPPEEFFWADYENIIAGWTSYAVSFDETGMTVAFSPYELAAYAAGPQIFHLSYDWLESRFSGFGREVLGLAAG